MSRSQKAVFIGLGAILVLFIVLMIWGQTRPGCEGTDKVCADQYQPSAGMKRLGKLFSSSGSKVKLAETRFVLAPGAQQRIDVPAEPKARLRTLKLRLVQGQQVQLKMFNQESSPGLDLSDQENQQLPRDGRADESEEDKRSISFTVTRSGGTLIIACPPVSDCIVEAD